MTEKENFSLIEDAEYSLVSLNVIVEEKYEKGYEGSKDIYNVEHIAWDKLGSFGEELEWGG